MSGASFRVAPKNGTTSDGHDRIIGNTQCYRANGNPTCQRGSYRTRSIAPKKPTVTPLFPH
jgi:hypothetical protein